MPYTYKPLPSTLPPSSTADSNGAERDKYVVSNSGHSASPEDVIASCHALQAHIKKLQEDAEKAINDWDAKLKKEELAEKRRVAPGWLDRSEKILEPERKLNTQPSSQASCTPVPATNLMDAPEADKDGHTASQDTDHVVGDELDRAFGYMNITRS